MKGPGERWAEKLVEKHDVEQNKEIVHLRTKLEIRTWISRLLLGYAMAVTILCLQLILKQLGVW